MSCRVRISRDKNVHFNHGMLTRQQYFPFPTYTREHNKQSGGSLAMHRANAAS